MTKVNLIRIRIRRDAHTTTPDTVTEHEIPILKTIFGEENVHAIDGKLIDLAETKPVGVYDIKSIEHERGRLERKYGEEVVIHVYGAAALNNLKDKIRIIKEEAPEEASKSEEKEEKTERQILMQKAAELGIEFDSKISTKSLADKVEKKLDELEKGKELEKDKED